LNVELVNNDKYQINVLTGIIDIFDFPLGKSCREDRKMLKIDNQQISFTDYLIPEELTVLDDELSIIDEYLNDDKIVQPFVEHYHKKHGRPSTPLQVYLRIMYIKCMYSFSYEILQQRVSDSIKWRRFCHIPLDAKVPDGSTLCKLTKLFGDESFDELNKIIITKAVEEKRIKARKVRIDTTVAESNIHYPTDAELLGDCVRVITRTVNRIADAADDAAGKIRNRGRSIKKKILVIAKTSKRRTREKFDEIREITGQIAEVAKHTVEDAKEVLAKAKQVAGTKIKGKTQKLIDELSDVIQLADKVIEQTEEVNKGNFNLKDRVVSVFDQGARPIKKGKIKTPTEFGRKVLIAESEEGVITHYDVFEGNPSDDSLLIDAVKGHQNNVGRTPKEVATDRGFYSKDNEDDLYTLGVKRVSMPKRGKKSKARKELEFAFWFKRLQRLGQVMRLPSVC
jgi:IS5 family transposase